MTMPKLCAAALLLGLTVQTPALAQMAPRAPVSAAAGAPDAALTAQQRDAIVAAVEAAFRKSYVFPDKVPAIVARLDASNRAGRYAVTSPAELAGLITGDLNKASGDEHAYMMYDPARYAAVSQAPEAQADDELSAFDATAARRDNYGLTDMRILPGNLRYLKISGFEWVNDETGKAYDDAMTFLKGGDAAIIDLRGNGGGAAEAVRYLTSHFLKAGTLEITFLEAGKPPVQSRSLDSLPAGRMIGKPLYVLIDENVGSAAESFAYDVQQFKLGQLIGATTAGAANNNRFVPIAPGFMLSVSYGRPVHAVSQGNWEGKGVSPDVAVAPAQALDMAQSLALKGLLATAGADHKADYAWAAVAADAHLHPVTLSPAAAQALTGTYGKYVVTADADGLWIARPGHPRWPHPRRLHPLTATLFSVDDIDMLRIEFTGKGVNLWWQGDAQPQTFAKS